MMDNWTAFATELLKGRRITSVRYLTDKEMDDVGWHRRPVCLCLDNGTWLIVVADNEGNDGGALQVITNEFKLIPTL